MEWEAVKLSKDWLLVLQVKRTGNEVQLLVACRCNGQQPSAAWVLAPQEFSL